MRTGGLSGSGIQLLLRFRQFCLCLRGLALSSSLGSLSHQHPGKLCRLRPDLPQIFRQLAFFVLKITV